MEKISFNQLLFQTAFCCMSCDGDIDKREIATIQAMCEKSSLFQDFDFQTEINALVEKINTEGKRFMASYFNLLKETDLTAEEELTLIDFAIQTILADEVIEYSEIKFFKNIRHRLKVSDEDILSRFPDIENWLEDDIMTDSFLDTITKQYMELFNQPQFDLIKIDSAGKPENKH
jgi:uncharacterized tellurite resistance protein B-like protein